MEKKKQVGSSSSFGADLFGSKKSSHPASSTGIFASIFSPPSSVVGRNYSCSEIRGYLQKQSTRGEMWSKKQETAETIAEENKGANNGITNTERKSIFLERVETCPLSSSLYYGGQEDMYICSSSTKSSASYPIFTNNGVEEDPYGINSESACRGNWWQGSLYY